MTDSASAAGSAGDPNVCYRHSDRRSFVLCQRCGRTVCGECQTPAPVGVRCPECMAEAAAAMPRQKSPLLRAVRRGSSTPVVTYTILGLTLGVFILQFATQGTVTRALGYAPPLSLIEPWRMLTVSLVHSSGIFHILFNMYALFVLGPLLEQLVGRWRFAVTYILSTLAGSIAVLWLAPASFVVGASGAIFGLFGAFFVIQRRLGGNTAQLMVILGINLALGFFLPNISWQAHVGGLIGGAIVALIFVRTRRRQQTPLQIALLGAFAALLVAGTILRFALAG
ncbi:membrane associated rhomboid family serine protease [Microcella putealis]|uniref:Membrane associated rhomboid family serine protease n=2 Tax=Microcella putealis TaxID=337005 RepID=A0A4Q7LRD1_9MICO|nr:membrane associated rhomboid family serine protease [Microcella putealis]